MAGLALPAVPMSEVVAGYSYDLLSDDELSGLIDAIEAVACAATEVCDD